MKVKKLWIVTKPTPDSELSDILFETDMEGLERQFRGGLTPEEIFAVYIDEGEASIDAIMLLDGIQ